MNSDDADLIALIDGELDEIRERALRDRIAADASLRQRYETLRDQRAVIGAALDSLLPEAPVERLRAFIPAEAPPRPAPRFGGLALRELAAGLAIGFALAAALTAFLISRGTAEDDWRSAVVAYMALYTNETFAHIAADGGARAQELQAVGARVGAKLTPESVVLPGLSLRTAFILAYDEKPLGEVVQTNSNGAPVLFCVIADRAADAPLKSERRDGFSLASWSRNGKGYLVIAALPETQVADYARVLETRF